MYGCGFIISVLDLKYKSKEYNYEEITKKYGKITLSYNKGVCFFMENGVLAKVDVTKELNRNLSTIRNLKNIKGAY